MGTVEVQGRFGYRTSAGGRHAVLAMVVVGVTVAVHWQALLLPFTAADTFGLLYQAAHGSPIDLLTQPLLEGTPGWPQDAYWRPVGMLTYWVTWQLFGLNPTGHHAFDLALHLLVGGALYRLLLEVEMRRALAGVATCLFLVHPATTSVVWASPRRFDLLAALFVLVAVRQFSIACRTQSRARAAAAAAALVAGVLSKEIAVVGLVPMVVVWDRRAWSAVWPVVAVGSTLALRSLVVAGGTSTSSLEQARQAVTNVAAAVAPVDAAAAWAPIVAVAAVVAAHLAQRHISPAGQIGLVLIGAVTAIMAATGVPDVRSSYLAVAGFSVAVVALAGRTYQVRPWVPAVLIVVALSGWFLAPPRWSEASAQDWPLVASAIADCDGQDVEPEPLPPPRAAIQEAAHIPGVAVRAAVELACQGVP